VKGIIDLIGAPGLINLDFADIQSVMKDAGPALIGLGRGSGEHRATDAARQAIASPLLEASFEAARRILFNVSGPADLRLGEIRQAAEEIREHADADANIIFGASFSTTLGEDVLVTLIATGLDGHERPQAAIAKAEVPRDAVPPALAAAAARPPKRPARPVKAAPPADAVVPSADVAGHVAQESPSPDDDDLEVPSFLRRRAKPG
jgi:cell division protein FtsZ